MIRMSQSCRISHRQALTQSICLRISKSQRIALWVRLLEDLRDEQYEPEARCPSCYRVLTHAEIHYGFRRDSETDRTVRCIKCKERFLVQLVLKRQASRVEMPYYCALQASERLRKYLLLLPEQIQSRDAGAYQSAIIHFGTLKAMFQSMDMEYAHSEITDWKKKAMPYLGKVPDRMLARVLSVHHTSIGRLRHKEGIDPCSKDTMLEL